MIPLFPILAPLLAPGAKGHVTRYHLFVRAIHNVITQIQEDWIIYIIKNAMRLDSMVKRKRKNPTARKFKDCFIILYPRI